MIRSLWNNQDNPILKSLKPREFDFHCDTASRQLANNSSEYFVNVEDTALLHVAAGLLDHVRSQRVFAFGGKFSIDEILAIMRDIAPARTLPADFSGGEDKTVIVPRDKAEALLKEMGRPGWTSLADTIAQNVEEP